MGTTRPVGILCADGIEEVEVTAPRRALEEAGFEVRVLSPDGDAVRAYHYIRPGDRLEVDGAIADTRPEDLACLVVPGGLGGPDTLRHRPDAVDLVGRFARLERPLATICHGPWVLIEAGVLDGRALTCADQIATDVRNAGGVHVDADAHVDAASTPTLVSGRNHETVDDFAGLLVDTLRAAAVPA